MNHEDNTGFPTPRGVCPECGADWRAVFEAGDLTAPLRTRLKAWRFKMDLLLWTYLGISVIGAVVGKQLGFQMVFKGWSALVALFVSVAPLVAIIAGYILGGRRIERAVCREGGVFCLDCGIAPLAIEMVDWIESNACGKCGGRLQRDFSNLEYKETWPSWPENGCEHGQRTASWDRNQGDQGSVGPTDVHQENSKT